MKEADSPAFLSRLPRELCNERLRNFRRLYFTLDDSGIRYCLPIEGFVAGFIGFQGGAIKTEAGESSLGVTEE